MAYVVPAPTPAATQSNESWKAQAFLNLFIKKPDGTRAKVGAIPLKTSRKMDRALIERLQQDDGVEAMKSVLELDFQMVDDGAVPELGF